MRSKRATKSGARERSFETNLFDDPERDDDSVGGWPDDERTPLYETADASDSEDSWIEESFELDVDERCSGCNGTGLVTYADERDEDECHQCAGTGYFLRI